MISGSGRSRLAVLGSPIAHSKSPAIQRAAYAELGLDWTYEAIEVTGDELAGFVRSRDAAWRGLSLTMPLKREVLPLLHHRHPLVELTGVANTVLLDGMAGFNTDVHGVEQSFRDAGIDRLDSVQVLGAGATAASAIVAVARLGAARVHVTARSPELAHPLIDLGAAVGTEVRVRSWLRPAEGTPDAVISTLPGGQNDLEFPQSVRESAVLFDVAYDPWPSRLADEWTRVGGRVIPGIDLLVNQAVGQVRIFVSGDADAALPDEPAVVAAMRAAAGA